MPQPMYRFLELTVEQYMTQRGANRALLHKSTRTGRALPTPRFNAFPVVETGRLTDVVTKF